VNGGPRGVRIRRHQGRRAGVDTGTVNRFRHPATALALVLLLFPGLPLAAETFLLLVTETQDGGRARPPFTAREGVLAALFEDGQIAFEVPADQAQPGMDDLPRIGAEAGAGAIAVIVVDWHEERLDGGATRVSCRGSIVLIDPATGARSEPITLALDNQDRERTVDRPRLGVEIGLFLVRAWQGGAPSR
jgi:hypothetical protein